MFEGELDPIPLGKKIRTMTKSAYERHDVQAQL